LISLILLFFFGKYIPIIDIVKLKTTSDEKFLKEISKISIIRLFIESQVSAVSKIGSEF